MSTMEYDENLPLSLLNEKCISQKFNQMPEIQDAIINSHYVEMGNRKSHKGDHGFAVLGRKSVLPCNKLVGFMPIITGTAKSLTKCSDKKRKYEFILNALTSLRIFAEHNIVHGDIKPDNISDTGQFLDFGGSAIKPVDNQCKTVTPNYVSIWQWKEKSLGRPYHKANDKFRQDSYGLAITILYLFCQEFIKGLEKNIRNLLNGDCCKTPRSRHSSQHCRSLLSVSEDNIGETKRRNRYFATVPNGNGDSNQDIQTMVTNIQKQINQTEFPVFNSDEFKTLLLDMTGTNLVSTYTDGNNLDGLGLIERINNFLENETISREQSEKVDEEFRRGLGRQKKRVVNHGRRATN